MKKTIKMMLAGVLMVPALALGVAAVAPVADNTAFAALDARGGANSAKGTGVPDDVTEQDGLIQRVVNILLFIIGAVAVIMLIIGGIRYTLSGGDQSAVTAAKNTILYAIVGIIVAIFAYAIVNFVLDEFLG